MTKLEMNKVKRVHMHQKREKKDHREEKEVGATLGHRVIVNHDHIIIKERPEHQQVEDKHNLLDPIVEGAEAFS